MRVRDLVALLDVLSNVRRAAEQALKAGRILHRLTQPVGIPGAEEASGAAPFSEKTAEYILARERRSRPSCTKKPE